eukprot:6627362-Pyramimonas_sp.AAC.1
MALLWPPATCAVMLQDARKDKGIVLALARAVEAAVSPKIGDPLEEVLAHQDVVNPVRHAVVGLPGVLVLAFGGLRRTWPLEFDQAGPRCMPRLSGQRIDNAQVTLASDVAQLWAA